MGDEFISYNDIFDGQEYIPEKSDKKSFEPDPYIAQDLITLFKMRTISDETNIFIGEQKKKIDRLKNQLHYSYDDFDQKNDNHANKDRSKNTLENVRWKEEINVVREEEKINILRYIAQKGFIIDRFKFIGEHDLPVTCLSVAIWSIDVWDDEDEDPCVLINAEFVLNVAWGIESPVEDDTAWEINIDEIKELIVDNTKYTFLL